MMPIVVLELVPAQEVEINSATTVQ